MKTPTIPVLSLWQPWATLLVAGEKHIETRSWAFLGPLPACLGIHAAKKWSKEQREVCLKDPFLATLEKNVNHADDLPRGVLVGVCRLVECVSTNLISITDANVPCLAKKYLEVFPNERHFGDYSPGRYAWAFDQRLMLDVPIPIIGQQGIWQWTPPKDIAYWCEEALQGLHV